ncbi:hypothetical protein ACEOSY_03290 [Pseudomonas aeruginosa]|uniref:hypothetical protein n=1 Tax=Pseudomonas aeruginosa TaxID=287 RepID=UPI00300582DC
MSSTQHQLIEQCATRLRGIVEALDNIHDTSPQRWSTDLDDVHSSAESLLAMIKDQAPARSEASFEEWLANELEGEDGQPVPAAVCDIALARRAFNHWPKLEQPAKVGGVRFSAGVSSRLVVEAAQRLYEFESTPEQEAERIERLQAFREQLDPLNLAPHAEAFNEAPAEALRPEQAEAERPEVVAWQYRVTAGPQTGWSLWHPGKGEEFERSYTVERRPLMTIAQHECIVGELRAVIAQLRQHKNDYMDSGQETYRALQNEIREREAEIARLDGLVSGRMAERDAALARVAEVEAKLADLEKQEPFYYFADCDDTDHSGLHNTLGDALTQVADHGGSVVELYRKPPAQAQHSVPEISGIGRDAEHPRAVVLYLRNEPSDEDMRAIQNFLRAISADVLTQALHSVPEASEQEKEQGWTLDYRFVERVTDLAASRTEYTTSMEATEQVLLAARELLAAAPGNSVPQAWLDVQAERRRQITAEGWTPEHDDEHADGQMARAAACYALAGSSAPNDGTAALLVSLAWPWDEQWWKPSTARRDLVKACALALAEIERLDRACISQSPQPGATTASS